MIIRPETPQDHQAIHDLTRDAFAPMPFGDENDAALTGELRKAGDLLLSIVADKDGVIGHAAFSKVILPCKGYWVGLGPISVRADHQKQGIGTALVNAGLTELWNRGYDGCVLIGNPKVYGPMGFISDGSITYRDLSAALVQWKSLSGMKPRGEVVFAPALEAT